MLLLWACLIWIIPKSRKWCLIMSPLFLIYGVGLLILQFIYGMQLLQTELAEYPEFGLIRYKTPCLHLLIKVCIKFYQKKNRILNGYLYSLLLILNNQDCIHATILVNIETTRNWNT